MSRCRPAIRWRLLAAALLSTSTAFAQSPSSVPDEQRRFLEVRRRQIELSAARTELERARHLFDQGLLSQVDLDRARVGQETAQLNYQEALLTLLGQQPRLSVRSALKSRAADGRTMVRLTVVNLSPRFDDSQFKLLSNFEGADPIPDSLRTRDLQDVFVSLKATGETVAGLSAVPRGTTVGLPYEVHLPSLAYGESKALDFELLRDLGSVIVSASYKGQVQETDIQLQQAETAEVVTVSSTQISQEADLGGQATYDLRLERSTVDVRRFALKVLNLPRQVSYSFLDQNGARLSEINFPSGVAQQTLGLRLFLPERADERVPMDEPLEFWALVADETQAARFSEERAYSPEEIQKSRAGRLRLVVTPRGAGRIEVSAPSLFSEIEPGGQVSSTLSLRNTGTRRLDNVRLTAECPLNWRAELQPDIVPALDINRETQVTLRIEPPAEVPVGDYEVRIKTESHAYNRQVPSEDKIYRISVKSGASLLGTLVVLGLLLLLIGGIVVFGLRLSRR
jgi:hypothetical protein